MVSSMLIHSKKVELNSNIFGAIPVIRIHFFKFLTTSVCYACVRVCVYVCVCVCVRERESGREEERGSE